MPCLSRHKAAFESTTALAHELLPVIEASKQQAPAMAERRRAHFAELGKADPSKASSRKLVVAVDDSEAVHAG